MKSLACLLTILSLTTASGSHAAVSDDLIQSIENHVRSARAVEGAPGLPLDVLMQQLHVPGVAVVMIEDSEVAWFRGYGTARKGSDTAITEDTLFMGGSLSKPVAAAVALALVEEGELDLETSVNEILSDWKLMNEHSGKEAFINVPHLLSHTGGVKEDTFRGYGAGEQLPSFLQVLNGEFPANSPKIMTDRHPRFGHRYCEGSYVVLEQVLTDRTGESFAELAHRLVLEPLEMESSTFAQGLPSELAKRASFGHRPSGAVYPDRGYRFVAAAANGLWTTPLDYAKFLIEVQLSCHDESNLVLSMDLASSMASPVEEQPAGWGFQTEKPGYFGHDGLIAGFHSEAIMHREHGYGALVMTNSENGAPLCQAVLHTIASEAGWSDWTAEEEAGSMAQLSDADKASMTGRFELTPNDALRVSEENGWFVLHAWNAQEYRLIPQSNSEALDPWNNVKVRWIWEGDQVIELVMEAGEDSIRAVPYDEGAATPVELLFDGKLQEARDKFEVLYARDETDPLISEASLIELGRSFLKLDRAEVAVIPLELGAEIYPNSVFLQEALAEIHESRGDQANAAKAHARVLELLEEQDLDPMLAQQMKARAEYGREHPAGQ